jgi:hypothetical protein
MGLIAGLASTIAHAVSNTSHPATPQQSYYGAPAGYGAPATAYSGCASQNCKICAVMPHPSVRRQMKRQRRAMRHAAKAYRFSGGQYPVMPLVAGCHASHTSYGQYVQPQPAAAQTAGYYGPSPARSVPQPQQPLHREASRELDEEEYEYQDEVEHEKAGATSDMPPAYERGEYDRQRQSLQGTRQPKEPLF